MHHYGCVALYEASILQKGRFWAASLASSRSMSNEVRSTLMFMSQVERGHPGGLLQSSIGGSSSIQFASASPSIWAICQMSERRLLLTMEECGGCSVMWPISSFLTKSPHLGPGYPLSAFAPPLSIHFLIFCSLLLSLFPFLVHFTYFLLLSIRFLSTRIVPLRFQAWGRRRRPNLGLVCFLFMIVLSVLLN